MKVLIVKTSSLGDIIHAFPVAAYIHHLYPKAQIDWVVEEPYRELVEAHPFIERVLSIHTKKWRKQLLKKETWEKIIKTKKAIQQVKYDIVFDLQGNTKSAFFTYFARSALKVGFGKEFVAEWPNLLVTKRQFNPPLGKNIREDYLFLAQSIFKEPFNLSNLTQLCISQEEQYKIDQILNHACLQDGLKIMVCPGSIWENKKLSPSTLQAFLRPIHDRLKGRFILVWGTQEEKREGEKLAEAFPGHAVVADRYSFPALQNLMSKMDLIIAMDSLPLHLAGTTHTPTFSCFGPSLADKYKPLGKSHYASQGNCPYHQAFQNRCPLLRNCPSGACMKNRQGEELFQQLAGWLDTYRILA